MLLQCFKKYGSVVYYLRVTTSPLSITYGKPLAYIGERYVHTPAEQLSAPPNRLLLT